MTITIKANVDGLSGSIQANSNDVIKFDQSGITQGAPLSFRNKIINGDMRIAQRGNSFTNVTGATPVFCADRFMYGATSAGVVTLTQHADGPANTEFINSMRVAVTTADTSIAASDYAFITQIIEGNNIRDLVGKTFTLSFYVRSSKTGIHCVSLRNSGADRSYIAEYTINTANTWEKKTVTVVDGLPSAGTWDFTNGLGLRIGFALMAGSTYQGTSNAWISSNALATANQVNVLDTVGNIFAITGVQLEAGPLATSFEQRPHGLELSLCQRYFTKTPGTSTSLVKAGGTWASTAHRFPVTMRSAPTISTTVLSTQGDWTTGGASSWVMTIDDAKYGSQSGNSGSVEFTATFSAEL